MHSCVRRSEPAAPQESGHPAGLGRLRPARCVLVSAAADAAGECHVCSGGRERVGQHRGAGCSHNTQSPGEGLNFNITITAVSAIRTRKRSNWSDLFLIFSIVCVDVCSFISVPPLMKACRTSFSVPPGRGRQFTVWPGGGAWGLQGPGGAPGTLSCRPGPIRKQAAVTWRPGAQSSAGKEAGSATGTVSWMNEGKDHRYDLTRLSKHQLSRGSHTKPKPFTAVYWLLCIHVYLFINNQTWTFNPAQQSTFRFCVHFRNHKLSTELYLFPDPLPKCIKCHSDLLIRHICSCLRVGGAQEATGGRKPFRNAGDQLGALAWASGGWSSDSGQGEMAWMEFMNERYPAV